MLVLYCLDFDSLNCGRSWLLLPHRRCAFWNLDTGVSTAQLVETSGFVDISWHGLGTVLSAISKDKHLRLWDPRSEAVVQV